MARPVVLLPQPDSPTSPSVSPRLTLNVMSSTARTQPTWRCRMMPWVIGKYILRFWTCSSSPSAVPFSGTVIGLALVAMCWVASWLDALCNGLGVRFAAAGDVDPAGDAVTRHDWLEGRIFGDAALDGVWAARLEGTAWRRIDQIRRQTVDRHELFFARLIQTRDRLEQAERV